MHEACDSRLIFLCVIHVGFQPRSPQEGGYFPSLGDQVLRGTSHQGQVVSECQRDCLLGAGLELEVLVSCDQPLDQRYVFECEQYRAEGVSLYCTSARVVYWVGGS